MPSAPWFKSAKLFKTLEPNVYCIKIKFGMSQKNRAISEFAKLDIDVDTSMGWKRC